MEREVGEVFDFKGVKLEVKIPYKKDCCDGCHFDNIEYSCDSSECDIYVGYCYGPFRSDGKNVIFVEVKDEN